MTFQFNTCCSSEFTCNIGINENTRIQSMPNEEENSLDLTDFTATRTTRAMILPLAFILLMLTLSSGSTSPVSKVFNYLGQLPIREEQTGFDQNNDTSLAEMVASNNTSAAEAACWQLIHEQSVITFALQKKVLDELDADMKNLNMEEDLRDAVDRLTKSMRQNMKEASEALAKDSAEEFFDALFSTSEDIINLSVLVRDPKMSDEIFMTLVKAISRLGRNNTILIQEFTDMCSFIQRGPRPRTSSG